MEGFLKTDDRMRLAKERREERERSLGKNSPGFFLLLSESIKMRPFPKCLKFIVLI